MILSRHFLFVFLLLAAAGCTRSDDTNPPGDVQTLTVSHNLAVPDEFGDYWYQGKAELSSYDLKQARYGELRDGEAVLIYVTEDFSPTELVKVDRPDQPGRDHVKVMKLNLTKKFVTGLYPYSMMSSIFTPIPSVGLPTLKVTTTSQEWCGHTFTQFGWSDNGYDVLHASYFQSEESGTMKIDNVLLEDEIWNTIRLQPDNLPVGNLTIVPGQLYQRLSHTPIAPSTAIATLSSHEDGSSTYTLDYPALSRTLSINFSSSFPYTINGWEESHRSGFGPNSKELTTTATLRKRIVSDYWTKNSVADEALRAELGLN